MTSPNIFSKPPTHSTERVNQPSRKRNLEEDYTEEKGDLRYSKILKRLEPVHEIKRQDSFLLGLHSYNEYLKEMIDEIEDDELKKVFANIKNPLSAPEEKFTKEQEACIKKIADTQSASVSNQFEELIRILKRNRSSSSPEGKALLKYALKVINQIPKNKPKSSAEKVDATYLAFANRMMEELGVNSSETAMRLAQNLQTASDSPEEAEKRQELIEEASQQLGELLLVADRSLSDAISCLKGRSQAIQSEQISTISSQIIEESAERVKEHQSSHEESLIQSAKEATVQKISVEMAGLLLLKSGAINSGIREKLSDALVPEEIANTICIQDILNTLGRICTTPEIRNQLYQVNPPESKEIPSDLAIRVTLGLPMDDKISKQDAQQYVLSALLTHVRQAFAGTCFATCWLIKAWNDSLPHVVSDLIDCVEKGTVSRTVFSHFKEFPFQNRVTTEYLNTLITAEADGKITSAKRYVVRGLKDHREGHSLASSYLHEAPGIRAACGFLGFSNAQSAIQSALQSLAAPFSVKQLLEQLSKEALEIQHSRRRVLRSQEELTLEQLKERAIYAFGAQTNHTLLRGYESINASMVNYFSSEYGMPAWIHTAFKEVIEQKSKGQPSEIQQIYREILGHSFLPMIKRMRYRYNHNFNDEYLLFNDHNHGTLHHSSYGYELCDAGLPKDFEYDNSLWKDWNQDASSITIHRFTEFQSPHKWKKIHNSEEFKSFIKSIITDTVAHLGLGENQQYKKLLSEAEVLFINEIEKDSFVKKVIHKIFGHGKEQAKDLDKNPYSMDSLPWKYRWGGDFNKVLKTFFGFSKSPTRLKNFNGTQKEVLAKCINYVKKQPDHIKQEFEENYERTIITSPVHAFLLTPSEESFEEAWNSTTPTNQYIDQKIIAPGVEVANSNASRKLRNSVIETVANNQLVSRYFEKHDFERLQLTDFSKKYLSELLLGTTDIYQLSVKEFAKELLALVYESRIADSKIGVRSQHWEKQFAKKLQKKIDSLIPKDQMEKQISKKVREELINFVRDHRDTIFLSDSGAEKFRTLMEGPAGLSVQEFRDKILKNYFKALSEEQFEPHKHWKEKFCELLDSTIFKNLSKKQQETIIDAGIITHDSNWKEEIYDCHILFTVNPGTGDLEMCKYAPDTGNLSFMAQKDWFPKGNDHGYWQFPDNYRTWKNEPLFNVRKMMDL